ncbi:MAG: DUF2726 domain-containing protein [Phycisphaeraceae bacterium]|nr:DUF2726 domain-containing protein [Phycisphaeraceae bacterium]
MSVSFVLGIVIASVLWKGEFTRLNKPKRTKGERYPFRRGERLMSEQEQAMYQTIQREMGNGNLLFPKVRLTEVVDLPKSVDRRDFLMNLVGSKSLDFVICDEQKLTPIIGIQLPKRNDADVDLIAEVMDSAGMPFLVLPNKRAFEPGELNELIRETVRRRRRAAPAATEPVVEE